MNNNISKYYKRGETLTLFIVVRFQFAISCIYEKTSLFDIVIYCFDKLCRFSQKSSFSNSKNSSKMHQIVNRKMDFSKMHNIPNREIRKDLLRKIVKNALNRKSCRKVTIFQKYPRSRIAKLKMTLFQNHESQNQNVTIFQNCSRSWIANSKMTIFLKIRQKLTKSRIAKSKSDDFSKMHKLAPPSLSDFY